MITNLFLQAVARFVKARIETLTQEMETTLNFATFEQELTELMHQVCTVISAIKLAELLASVEFLEKLKQLGSRKGMRFKEYRIVTVYLGGGKTARIPTPYFIKAKPKRGRKKRGPNGRGAHLGLAVLGLIGRSSSVLVSEVVKMAVLCPSFEIAKEMLAGRGVQIDVSTMRRFCRQLARQGVRFRGQVSLAGNEDLRGYTLVIGVDGGRLRERCPKRGRKKKGQKRQGYRGEWREPKLFTIYLLDKQGKGVNSFSPLHDATMGDHQEMFALLERYLTALPLADAARLVFCGDGAPWIWSDVEELCRRMGLSEKCAVYQVLDNIHAQQNLQHIIDLVAMRVKRKEKIEETWRTLLWNGDIQGIYQEICRVLTGRKRSQALKKWQNYFEGNEKRMQYKAFKTANIPCGSGCVESAIRRIINLRLKSAGTFWKRDMAEYFLFLRSQLLSGRWLIFLSNVTRQQARLLLNFHDCQGVELFQPTFANA
jgi:hypothetical protein